MKNFIKIFFTALCLFIPIFASATGLNQLSAQFQPLQIIETPSSQNNESSCFNKNYNETYIAAVNTRNLELSALQDRRSPQGFGNIDKSSAQNKLLQQIFTSNYNKLYFSTSHKLSSYLKNEICTRAP